MTEQKADKFFNLAQENINASKNSFLNFFMGKSRQEDLLEKAIENLTSAADNYKLIKKFDKYLSSLLLRLELETKINYFNYFNTLMEVGNYYANENHFDEINALKYYNIAILHAAEFKTDSIYKVCERVINLCEKKNMNEDLIAFGEDILEKYRHLMNDSHVNEILLRLAEKNFLIYEFKNAFEYFDLYISKISNSVISYLLLEKYLFRALLCILADGDLVATTKKLNSYLNLYASFSKSRYCDFFREILKSAEDNDINVFQNAIKEYDTYYHFSDPVTDALLKIKDLYLTNEPDLT